MGRRSVQACRKTPDEPPQTAPPIRKEHSPLSVGVRPPTIHPHAPDAEAGSRETNYSNGVRCQGRTSRRARSIDGRAL